MKHTLIILPALAALALPGVSFAQSAQTITINGNVAPACTLGAPTAATLQLGRLNGTDGKIAAALASSAVATQTTIANAWCNTSSTITLTSSPLRHASNVTLPGNFTREVAFTAELKNWASPVINRALTDGVAVPVDAASAHAAAPLSIEFSSLTPVKAGVADQNLFIEAGDYSATIFITLAVKN